MGKEAVGRVDQAVEVERSGEDQIGRHHKRCTGQRAEQLVSGGPQQPEQQTEGGADDRQPAVRGSRRRRRAPEDRQETHRRSQAAGGIPGAVRGDRVACLVGGGRRSRSGRQLDHPAGHHQQAAVGHFGHPAVDLTQQVGEAAAGRGRRVHAEAHLLGHDDDVGVTVPERGDQRVHVRAAGGGPHGVGHPHPQGVDQDRPVRAGQGAGQVVGLLHRHPVPGPAAPVPLDPGGEVGVAVGTARGGHVRHRSRPRQRLGHLGFARAHPAQHQGDQPPASGASSLRTSFPRALRGSASTKWTAFGHL